MICYWPQYKQCHLSYDFGWSFVTYFMLPKKFLSIIIIWFVWSNGHCHFATRYHVSSSLNLTKKQIEKKEPNAVNVKPKKSLERESYFSQWMPLCLFFVHVRMKSERCCTVWKITLNQPDELICNGQFCLLKRLVRVLQLRRFKNKYVALSYYFVWIMWLLSRLSLSLFFDRISRIHRVLFLNNFE